MANKKKFEGTEVVVSAPRMRDREKQRYDNDKRFSEKTGMPMNQVPPYARKKNREEMDQMMGFLGGPVAISKINIRKIPALKRFAEDVMYRIGTSGGDNVLKSFMPKEKEEKIPDDWEYDPYAYSQETSRRFAKGGLVKSRDGIAQRGKTKGRMR